MFDYEGKCLRQFGQPGKQKGKLATAYGIAADRAGNWLVIETGAHRVSVFAADGSFITAFGEKGRGPGQLKMPLSVCVDNDGRILVGDYCYRVQVFGFCNSEAAES